MNFTMIPIGFACLCLTDVVTALVAADPRSKFKSYSVYIANPVVRLVLACMISHLL